MAELEEKHSFLKTYIKGEALFGFWNIANKGITAINILLIISFLDVYKYGVYLLIMSFYTLVADIFLAPLQETIFNDISRYVADKKESSAKKLYLENFIIRMILAFLSCLFVFLGAKIVASYYGYDIADSFRILSVLFIIDAFYTSMRMFLQLKKRFGFISSRPVFHKIFRFIFLISFIYFFGLGVKEALISHILASFMVIIIFLPTFLKEYKPWRKIRAESGMILLKIIKTHGKWPVFSTILSGMTSNIRPWLIKVFVNTEAVAVFSVAQSFFEAIKTFMPNSTLSTLIPFEINDKEKSSNILVRGTKYLVIISLIFALAGLLIASPVASFVFPQYKDSIPLFQLFLLVLPIVSFRMMAVTFLVALRRQKFLFFASSIEIPIAFLSSVVLLYLFGVWGMVLQRIFITLIMGGLMYTYLLKQEYNNYRWKNLFTFNQEDKIFIKKIWGHCLNLYKRKIS